MVSNLNVQGVAKSGSKPQSQIYLSLDKLKYARQHLSLLALEY